MTYLQLIEEKRSNSSNTPPTFCTTSANVLHHFSSSVDTNNEPREIFSRQDKEILSMLVDLPTNVNFNRSMGISSQELGQQILRVKIDSEAKIKVLKKVLIMLQFKKDQRT